MSTHYPYHEVRFSKQLVHMLLVFVLLLLSACGEGLDNQRGKLVSQTELATIPASTASAIMNGYSSSGLLGLTAQYDVVAHKIVYKTPDINGDLIEASGLVVAPVKDHGSKSPVISLQHGTMFLDKAPSSMKGAADSAPEVSYADIAVMFASQGYIVAAADFIGYGDTVGIRLFMQIPWLRQPSICCAPPPLWLQPMHRFPIPMVSFSCLAIQRVAMLRWPHSVRWSWISQ